MPIATILACSHGFKEPATFLGCEPFEDRHKRFVAVGLVGGEVLAETRQSCGRENRIEGLCGQSALDMALRSAQVAHRCANAATEFTIRYGRCAGSRQFLASLFGKRSEQARETRGWVHASTPVR